MRVLALDASGACCSAALLDGGHCVAERHGGDSRAATSILPGLVADLLAEAGGGFDAVAVTVGPGSFTGLRGALALAHGLGIGAAVPVVGVSVAEALLHSRRHDGRLVWITLDPRRPGLVFLGRGPAMESVPLAALPQPPGPVLLLGDAALAVADALRRAGVHAVESIPAAVSAASVGRVGQRRLVGEIGACAAQPLYVEAPAARAW